MINTHILSYNMVTMYISQTVGTIGDRLVIHAIKCSGHMYYDFESHGSSDIRSLVSTIYLPLRG